MAGTEVTVPLHEALMQIGALAAEFVSQPETWPVFFAWMNASKWPLPPERSEGMRSDVLAILAALPESPNRDEIARTYPTRERA